MDKLIKKYDRTPIKTNLSTLQTIKISIDDSLLQYLRVHHKYKQNNLLTDLKIFIGLCSTIVAVIITYYSMTQDFVDYKALAAYLLIFYFTINGFLEFVVRFVNKGCIFRGTNEAGSIRIYSKLPQPNTNYILIAFLNNKTIPIKWNKNVCDLFDEEGTFLHKQFYSEIDTFFSENAK
ncbi:hypothetical protein BDAP_002836 [Binucleata daphniae]